MTDMDRPPTEGWTEEQARRIVSARSEADAADALVRDVSAARLAELQQLPVSVALRAIDDPSLTPEDREQLKRHITTASRHTARRRGSGRRRPRQWRTGYRTVLVGATLLVASGVAFVGWWNTPLGVVTVKNAVVVDWQTPGANPQRYLLQPGLRLVVVKRDDSEGRFRVRRWVDGAGYAGGDLPYAAFR